MTTAYFDLETTGVDADAAITVAAVKIVSEGDESYRIFHDGHGTTMGADTADKVVAVLEAADVVYSYNGAAFDFRMLAAAASDSTAAIEVCSRHRDVMLDFSATTGYYSAMNAWAADGATKTATGAWAATAWFTDEAPAVAEYCAADTDVLHKIVERGLAVGALARTAAATGRVSVWVLTDAVDGRPRFRTTAESIAAARDNPPDTSWMDNPPDITAAMQWARPRSP
jgi:hypothetical protein